MSENRKEDQYVEFAKAMIKGFSDIHDRMIGDIREFRNRNRKVNVEPEHPPNKITFDEFEDLLLKQIGEAFDVSREALFAAVDPAKPEFNPTPFNLSRPGWSVPKECTDCLGTLFSKSEPGCLKQGCSCEQKINSPKLIQGYTAEQWQEIIDGGYLCEFSGRNESRIELLRHIGADELFQASDFSEWPNCRPAQIKGVMRPIFVEPVDKNGKFVFFDGRGEVVAEARGWFESEIKRTISTKYIEV